MEIALVIAVGVMNLLCFMYGVKVGQSVKDSEPIEVPTVNPLEAYKEHKSKKETELEQQRIDTILRNIDRYDGTGNGQEDVPR